MSEKTDNDSSAKLLAFVLALLIRTPLDAWALLMFWGWFLIPLGAPPITFWHAMGLDLMVGMIFTFAARPQVKTEFLIVDPMYFALSKSIGILMVLGFGWIVAKIAGLA